MKHGNPIFPKTPFAIPTLIRKTPKPLRRIIGDLSNKEKVLIGLNSRTILVEDGK
jgi:hypothetical protein